jgi:hypothetical protein
MSNVRPPPATSCRRSIRPEGAEVDGGPFVRSADHQPRVKEGQIKATLGLLDLEHKVERVVNYKTRGCPWKYVFSEFGRALEEVERHVPAY